MAVLLLVLLAGGCGAAGAETPDLPDVKPGDNALIKAAWNAWGMAGTDRPAVQYVDGAGLNCETDHGPGFLVVDNPSFGPFFVPAGTDGAKCWLGFAIPERHSFVVVGDGAAPGITKKAIVHELCHFARSDDTHVGDCKPDGGRIDEIAASLR